MLARILVIFEVLSVMGPAEGVMLRAGNSPTDGRQHVIGSEWSDVHSVKAL